MHVGAWGVAIIVTVIRREAAHEARVIDDAIAMAWSRHPRRYVIDPAENFLAKAARAIEHLQREMPDCCRAHVVPGTEGLLDRA